MRNQETMKKLEAMSDRFIRQLTHVSQARVAVEAGVGVGLVRIFEIDRAAIGDASKRKSLERIYARLRNTIARAA